MKKTAQKTIKTKLPDKTSPRRVMKGQMVFEIAMVALIVFAVVMLRFIPWLSSQSVPTGDIYADNKILYNTVQTYDYSKGKNSSLETRLERGTTSTIAADNPTTYYFNLLAQAEYYAHFGYYRKAMDAIDLARDYAPDETERLHILDLYDTYEKSLQDSLE